MPPRSLRVIRGGKEQEPYEGVIRFPQRIARGGEQGEIVAWCSDAEKPIDAYCFEALQSAYGNALEVENRDGKPFIRRSLFLNSGDHARTEAASFQRLIRRHLGLKLMLQPAEDTPPKRRK